MSPYLLSMALVVASLTLYQVAQRAMPPTANPFALLVLVYGVALALSALGLLLYPGKEGLADLLREPSWAPWALGLAVVGIELGYLLVYRTGWPLALAPVVANVGTLLLLVPLGFLFFRETLSPGQLLGLLLALLGFILLRSQ